jgi:hypothetical protein
MDDAYDNWLSKVREALQSINMPLEKWQAAWQFDFSAEYRAGTDAGRAAEKANRFWWHEQNKALRQDCQQTPNCWLPTGHSGECVPVS